MPGGKRIKPALQGRAIVKRPLVREPRAGTSDEMFEELCEEPHQDKCDKCVASRSLIRLAMEKPTEAPQPHAQYY